MKLEQVPEWNGIQKMHIRDALMSASRHGYNALIAADNYCVSKYGIEASKYNYHYIWENPYTILMHGCGKLVKDDSNYDYTLLNWIANIMCEFQWAGITFPMQVGPIAPSEVAKKFNPLHEAPIKAGCRKLAEYYGIEYTPSPFPQYG